MLVLHVAFFEAAVADGDAVRHANELPVGKHGTGALATVVQNHIHAGCHQSFIEGRGGALNFGETVRADRADHHGERRYGVRPDDAALVMILLDGGSRQARDADAVAAHFHELRLAVFAQKSGIHGLAVFGAQVKNVTHFNTALNRQRALTVR